MNNKEYKLKGNMNTDNNLGGLDFNELLAINFEEMCTPSEEKINKALAKYSDRVFLPTLIALEKDIRLKFLPRNILEDIKKILIEESAKLAKTQNKEMTDDIKSMFEIACGQVVDQVNGKLVEFHERLEKIEQKPLDK